jgi:hypothetical protein
VQNPTTARDVVAAVLLAAGEPVDVQLTAQTSSASMDVALALFGQCGSPGSEIACSSGYDAPQGGRIAKVRGRGVGDVSGPTALPAFVLSDQVTLALDHTQIQLMVIIHAQSTSTYR